MPLWVKYEVLPWARPSRDAPLSLVNTKIVLSSWPRASSSAEMRATLSSIDSTMAAYTSM